MFDSLSEIQRKIVFEKNGLFAVKACPGSGKTYTTAARLAHKINNWQLPSRGIAVLSFTNVAWQEIRKMLDQNLGMAISYPHYLGTLDSFINKFIFLPFGHLIMGCGKRPVLVGEPHGTWSGGNYDYDYDQYFDCTSFSITDGVISTTADFTRFHFKWRNKDGSESGHVNKLRETKLKFWRQGYATQADANYFSLKILDKYPNIARSIAMRFPELIIDEAQDTSEIQLGIINKLVDNGLENVMLVGDPDQAIFEWNDARPDLFINKLNEWEENSVILDENRRSSQNICNVTYKLTSRARPSVAVTEAVKNYEHVPEIICYDQDNIQSTLDYFLRICEKHQVEMSHEKVAVIFRSKSIQNLILTQPVQIEYPWLVGKYFVRDLAKGKYMAENGNVFEAFRLIEKALYKGLHNKSFCSTNDLESWISARGFIRHRQEIMHLLRCLPSPVGSINEWVKQASDILKMNNVAIRMNLKPDCPDCDFDELFKITTERNLGFRMGTVHTFKGVTFDAVLLILREKGAQGSFYRTMLSRGLNTFDDEELRIAYVGMTRPRKLLVIAVPSEQSKLAWEQRLLR
ncbi:ATP-dependent helicase [Paenibacillus sediminis]|uniref:DNA 3'-5' helicase n=1 Tax=Paenibacillus sediminis TaxID=664909 RepID=A0ABS4H434_9BACL|nr:ATP-dependent helicase [Paenibacillus sediminis]MBP1937295.1 superfamily I DNA/RNA helicase [Paenibacillus sediminis]